ncbi:AAA family ATPase [Vibrio europaeus]|uniref:AAA family ATPase n=1 Tax=Vibrio europaeus TaxID=300876 RepID=UPI0018A78962|nr:AAA family ATPase [Vibrio europaeus]MDC5809271.1 AAA family ATPase [Vibrio europaeus]QPG36814.1 AAA family ATPase [Vibrio europaeus]
MKIHELRLKNFRKFIDSRYSFNTQSNVTVLIGDNATGKSAILNALSIMMGSYLLDFKVPQAARHIRKDEIRIAQIKSGEITSLEPQWAEGIEVSCIGSLAEVTCDDSFLSKPFSWSRELTSEKGKTTRINAKNIAKAGRDARLKVENGEAVLLPILSYYGTGRLWHKKQDIELDKPDSRAVGYRDCLDPASNHRLFYKWFSRLEQASLQKGKRFEVLEAVRNAVKTCIPNCESFYLDLELQELMLEFDDGRLYSFDNLSDGYRNMLAIVADIAHRAARLNPQLGKDAAISTPGIVLIDEIDLHLHPKWQREIINSLRNAFPKIQFIVSTHSPFIVQSLKRGEVIDLNSGESLPPNLELNDDEESVSTLAQPSPQKSYSEKSIEDIVEDIMGISFPSRSARLERMYQVAKKYYAALETSSESSVDKELLKEELDELSAPFSDSGDIAYYAFLEMARLSKGLGNSKHKEEK